MSKHEWDPVEHEFDVPRKRFTPDPLPGQTEEQWRQEQRRVAQNKRRRDVDDWGEYTGDYKGDFDD